MITKITKKLMRFFKLYILRDKFFCAHRRWVKDGGDKELRLNYDINKDSIVFDLGGYHGDFAAEINKKYGATVYVFEPVKEYFEIIMKRFTGNDKVNVFHFGLSDNNDEMEISVSGSSSSVYSVNASKTEKIKLKSITNFISEKGITAIDLFKINIEGGEFSVLPELIKTGYIDNINDLQVQFHAFVDDAVEKRIDIRRGLSKTHSLTYDYYFVWENWKKNVEG